MGKLYAHFSKQECLHHPFANNDFSGNIPLSHGRNIFVLWSNVAKNQSLIRTFKLTLMYNLLIEVCYAESDP